MISRNLLCGVAALCACVGAASATTTKIKAFTALGDGLTANPHVDGMAIIKFDSAIAGSTIHVHMQDLEANQVYGVAIVSTNSGDFDLSSPMGLTTNPSGNGSFEASLPTVDLGAHPTVYIYFWDGASDYSTIGGFDTAQFRAIGTVP